MRMLATAWLVLEVFGCSCGDDTTSTDGDADTDSDSDSDTASDTATATDTDTDSGSGSETDTDTDPGYCGGIVTFEDGHAPTTEVHVAEDGSDALGDGTAGNPYRTLGAGIGAASPGTAVVVHAGTYPGDTYVDALAGTADAPIWIGGAAGEARPVIDGGGESLHLTRVRYLVVHDLEATGATGNGINCDDGGAYDDPEASRFVVFRDLSIHDIGAGGNEDCLKLSGVNDYFVLDSEIARCGGGGSGSGIDHVGCHRGLIARNTLSENAGNAIQCKGGSEDLEIRWNTIVDGGERAVNMGGSTGYEFFRPPLSDAAPNFEARDIRVVANVIVRGAAPLAFVGCVDCLAAQNTIVDPEHWLMRILQETVSDATYEFLPSSGGRFVDNVVYYARASLTGKDVNVGGDTDPGSFTFSNDLWYAHDDVPRSEPTLPVGETDGVYGENPSFVDAAGGDYSIPETSPAVGAGIAVDGGAPGDRAGACWMAPPSIGAFEGG